MYPLVGVGLQLLPTVILALGRPAKNALAVLPAVLYPLIANVPAGVLKPGNGILAVGVFGTVQAPPGQQAGELGDGDAVKLLLEDVVDALLQIGDFLRQSVNKPLGDLPQEHPGFAGRVQEGGGAVLPDLRRQKVQHLVGHLRRGEHLVAAEVGQTGENIGVVDAAVKITHSPGPSCNQWADTPGWELGSVNLSPGHIPIRPYPSSAGLPGALEAHPA